MAQNIYRRDSKENLLRLIPSSKEIFTIEDNTKHGIYYFGRIRTLAQFFEKGEGIEIRDWDPNFSKGSIGSHALDLSISLTKYGTGAFGSTSFASGLDTTASGVSSTATGSGTIAEGQGSTASGVNTLASGDNSHAEGKDTSAIGINSHAEGKDTSAIGINSHAEGNNTSSEGINSHSEGSNTTAQNNNMHVAGSYNIGVSENTIHETGIGTSPSSKKNAFEIYINGILKAPETVVTELFSEMKALVTSEFVQEKIAIENWFTDFTYSSGTIFRSNIPEDDKHANISAVFQGGIMLRPSKYTLINDGGFKAVQIGSTITLNQGDWVSLQLNRVYYKDY